MPILSDEADPAGTAARAPLGTLRAVLDAIFKEDDRVAGRAVTRLTDELPLDDVTGALVMSTIGFGEDTDGEGNARFIVGGEVITATGRSTRYPFQFTGLTRAVSNTAAKRHPAGTLVYDMARNTSALDLLRRGFLVDYAVGEDLEIIARNHGLHRCPGTTQEQLRRIIKAVAYLPKNTVDAFKQALEALLGTTNFTVRERSTSEPWVVFVEIEIALATDIRGRFILNGGTRALTTGLNTVVTPYDVNHVIGVYLDTTLARRGYREGMANYYDPAGSFAGSTITLGTSPGAIGTAVIVDYGAHEAHYLAVDETVRQDINNGDRWAYLADPLFAARCLLDQIRAAGVQVRLTTRL